MKDNLIFLGLLIITFSSCVDQVDKKHNNIKYTELTTQKNSPLDQKEKSEKVDDTLSSFVLSCGSGCALTYNLKDNHFLEEEKISVTFSVTMWIDEKVSDEYSKSYIIKFSEGDVETIYSVDNKDFLTEEESPNLFKEIKKTGKTLHRR